MRQLIYSMAVSLDGFVADPGGGIDWTVPDEELFRFHTDRVRELGAVICGRRLYEAMLYWERADATRTGDESEREFARIWQALPKLVFSTTLETVGGNARLVRGGIAEEVARLREEPGKDVEVGGATLAASFVELDLIDDYRLFHYPVILGGGTPYFPPGRRLELELVETRTFAGRVVYTRYRRAR